MPMYINFLEYTDPDTNEPAYQQAIDYYEDTEVRQEFETEREEQAQNQNDDIIRFDKQLIIFWTKLQQIKSS